MELFVVVSLVVVCLCIPEKASKDLLPCLSSHKVVELCSHTHNDLTS